MPAYSSLYILLVELHTEGQSVNPRLSIRLRLDGTNSRNHRLPLARMNMVRGTAEQKPAGSQPAIESRSRQVVDDASGPFFCCSLCHLASLA
jgi:hypothetical protein